MKLEGAPLRQCEWKWCPERYKLWHPSQQQHIFGVSLDKSRGNQSMEVPDIPYSTINVASCETQLEFRALETY